MEKQKLKTIKESGENPVFSVIVPVYNAEKSLDRCVDSIVSQTYPYIEIILVDDGSTDGSACLCDEWAKKDGRIKVVHKENGGLGYARNSGIENATGDYLTFCDSDDFIDKTLVEKCFKRIKEDNSEIVFYGFNHADENGTVFADTTPSFKGGVYGEQLKNRLVYDVISSDSKKTEYSGLTVSACSMMCSKKLIDKIGFRFVSEREIIAEDVYSLITLYKSLESASIINEPLYYYCYNRKSLTHVFKEDRIAKISDFYLKSKSLIEKNGYKEETLIRVAFNAFNFYIGALTNASYDGKTFKKVIKELINDGVCREVLTLIKKDERIFKKRILIYFMLKRRYATVNFLMGLKRKK